MANTLMGEDRAKAWRIIKEARRDMLVGVRKAWGFVEATERRAYPVNGFFQNMEIV